ncbi:FAD-dependent monooxygenase [Ruania suaedae]|uniref:FAD-dependent oxidoreductase n=1 Tax=Ruania suaedae TaxID=2897774 RepID=UPI001E53C21C|nr:NAD(P)/FAD-dependent oxidoreductase [Ruania suaedae]UFU03612.1 FAD-dependent monooxygenase [Ruania suaedae]
MRVVIVGAGVGGLMLACGLQKSGFDVVVLERDVDLARTVGHGLELRRRAMEAIHALLPTEVLRRLYALAQGTWVETGYAVLDHQGRRLAPDQKVDRPDGVSTDRVTLRLLLAGAVGDALRTGVEVVGHELTADGGVRALLGSGEVVEGDLLVAADGAGSAITASLAGAPTSAPTSLIGLAGHTLSSRLEEDSQVMLRPGAAIAVGPGGASLYAGYHHALDQEVVRTFTASPLHPEPLYVWGAVMLEWTQTAHLADLHGEALIEAAREHLGSRGWTDELAAVVGRAEAASVTSYRFLGASAYPAGIAPWSPGAVTALGDAVHAMPPTGGRGASTAIRDAHVLHTELLAAREGRTSLVGAVGSYERQMRRYAARAVAKARQPRPWTVPDGVSGGPATRVPSLAGAAVSWSNSAEQEPQRV